VKRLVGVLQRLVDAGNSLIVIEHNLDILKVADWIIELGPEAGANGGRVIAQGSPEQIAAADCETAPYLREALREHRTSNPAGAGRERIERSTSNDVGTALADVQSAALPLAAESPSTYNPPPPHLPTGAASTKTVPPFKPSHLPTFPPSHPKTLAVRGAREHNLRNISCEIPHNALTVVTGVSGSGKSSLAFDIIFAEGQRRFMESMSAYARQFVEQMPRADVDELHGIAPTVAIEQRVTKGTRKSTVATITEVAQYLRLLYARIGIQHSPTTGEPVVTQSEAALLKRLRQLLAEHRNSKHSTRSRPAPAGSDALASRSSGVLYLCAPLIRGRKGHHQPLADWARDHGYSHLRIDGRLTETAKFKKLDRYKEHDIDLVVADLSPLKHSTTQALGDHLATALKLGKGTAFLMSPEAEVLAWLSTKRTDPTTGEAFPELDPKHFSWNSPRGWCPTCRGYGQLFDWMADEEESTVDHLDGFEHGTTCPDCQGTRLNPLSRAVRLPLKQPTNSPPSQGGVPEGRGGSRTSNKAKSKKHSARLRPAPAGFDVRRSMRWRPAPAGFNVQGSSASLPELLALTPGQLLDVLAAVKTDARSRPVLDELLPEIEERLRFMDRVGLGYLTLDRATATLSGGEAQRIRLAAQLGSNLSGVLYVLDEPSIGLHARDNESLIRSLEQLRDRGNTLVIVEHDVETMKHADQIIDLGPAAGIHGGEIVAQGTLAQLRKNKKSITGKYLRKAVPHPLRGHYRKLPRPWSPRRTVGMSEWIALRGAALRNLKGFDLAIPKNRLTAVCGVSGAGKSTLVRDLLKPLVEAAITTKNNHLRPKDSPSVISHSSFRALKGAASIRKVIEVDQSPIGKTPRSTPATYIGAFDIIRDIYASLPEANLRGHTAGTFSFNTKGGRCETCKGAGRVKLEMNFMPDTYVTCEDCNGRRYGAELDEIRWHGKSIADVLELSFEEAADFFSFHTQLANLMRLMVETGLGYITLGQYSPTLSGGEAQRLKLVSELAKGLPSFKERQYDKGQGNLYLLEEPTIGLHTSDVERLVELLHRLVDKGHTVVVIEHHLDLIADADYVVEIGPDGGDAGGRLLYQGDVAGLKKAKNSVTAKFLS
ncbi:MAG: excinuclease ABC subunit A, partial [Opitutales bacterium]